MMPSRPPPFPTGMELGKHFRVEALVRLSEGRMFYLVTDDRPDQRTRKCWECGETKNPRAATTCMSCGAEFDPRTQFLMSARWDPEGFEPYKQFFDKRFRHPGILHPDDVFEHKGVLCSVVRYRNESLMLDEASPLTPRQVIHMAQRFAGLLAYLHYNGVSLSNLSRANILLRRDENRLMLFDPDVAQVFDGPVPEDLRDRELTFLGDILKRFTGVNLNTLRDFFERAEQGEFRNPLEFGRAVESMFDRAERMKAQPGHAAMTDVGLMRILNEDNWSWIELNRDTHLFVVADGMGGHDSGEVASAVASATICKIARTRFEQTRGSLTPEMMENILDEAFQTANNTVKATAEERGNDMGTTLVALLVHGNLGLLANVGDSRGYLLRNGRLHQVSRDHSLVSKMVEQGRITAEEARTHPHSNILLRTVGTERDVEIDIFRLELENGDQFLLNSDGLWGEVEDADIENILNQYDDPRICARELIRAAHHGGGKDNITLMIASVT
ncbi:MAG: Stp1/IreP family PP2C-type Ser/Thr phosphatase [Alphaproteobacteria bacterium]|nr:Stp1/IreP family PP2C-type Ser/Thr phosphatase [Alphaproteobacteria bacterium]